jgi:hypothetical protein
MEDISLGLVLGASGIAIGLTEEHLKFKLFFSFFDTFLCEKFGLLDKSI